MFYNPCFMIYAFTLSLSASSSTQFSDFLINHVPMVYGEYILSMRLIPNMETRNVARAPCICLRTVLNTRRTYSGLACPAIARAPPSIMSHQQGFPGFHSETPNTQKERDH